MILLDISRTLETPSFFKPSLFNLVWSFKTIVSLLPFKEKDSTFSYLGCFNKCDNKTTTTTTTTKATTTKKTTTKNDNITTTKKTTTTTTTTTTTKIKGYSVIFNVAGGTNVNNQYIVKGNYAKAPVNPTKEGYKFDGWYLNNDLYDFNTPVNSNIILIAKWVPNN